MGSQVRSPHKQELDQLLDAYKSISDEHVRYFFSMMLQSVALAMTEAQQDGPSILKPREKHRASMAA